MHYLPQHTKYTIYMRLASACMRLASACRAVTKRCDQCTAACANIGEQDKQLLTYTRTNMWV